tara:strand:- start:571 stop:831 length:261 start_codon:yes stop_codon:yes gene_type:complete
MANTKQSIKRARQNITRYKLKHAQRSMARTAVKSVMSAIEENKIDEAKFLYKIAEKKLDKLASKKVIHKNKSSRIKSRLLKKIRLS